MGEGGEETYLEIQFRTEVLPLKLTTINLLVGSTAMRPWTSVKMPLNVLNVFAPFAVTVGQAPPEQVTAWPTAFSELQYDAAAYWEKNFNLERSDSVTLAVEGGLVHKCVW